MNGIEYDLKGINKNGKRTIKDKIQDAKGQTNNFIFDILNNDLEVNDVIETIEKLFNNLDLKNLNRVILLKENQILKIYKRK